MLQNLKKAATDIQGDTGPQTKMADFSWIYAIVWHKAAFPPHITHIQMDNNKKPVTCLSPYRSGEKGYICFLIINIFKFILLIQNSSFSCLLSEKII